MESLFYTTESTNQYKVFYTDDLNGGGIGFGSEYPSIIKTLYPNRIFNTCMEWCSGPGFIGYNILDHGLCNKLVLNDIYQPAIDIAKKTADHNNLSNVVSTYCTGDIGTLPNTIKVDLVVANPPHYDRVLDHPSKRIADDPNWEIHRNFYKKIGNYLTDDGAIIIQENADGSDVSMFEEMINDGNLKILDVIKSPQHFTVAPTLIYYIHITKRI
jgi:methylase of polypeptide subunit release factors